MAQVWSDERKLAAWLEVEFAALDAWAELGVVPREAARAVREQAQAPAPERVAELEQRTGHDLAAFVDAVQAGLGEEGRWLHYGLTSSDVVDTGLALQLRDAGALLLEGLEGALAAVVERAEEHRTTLCIGRTHDRHAEPLATLALVAASLERFALEIRHLARTEVREVQEPFASGQKGSSAMPHKRNPIVAERICGLARIVRAAAQVGLENVPLWHERDISHSSAERVVIPDAFLALDYMLDRFTWLVEGLIVDAERMRSNLEASHGLVFSQRVLTALVAGGLARDEAYHLVQRHAMRAWEEGLDFRELVESDPEIAPRLDPSVFDLADAVKHVDIVFERLAALTTQREEAVHA